MLWEPGSGSLPKYELSLPGQRARQGPGLGLVDASAHPSLCRFPEWYTHRERMACGGERGEGVSYTRRWSRGWSGRCGDSSPALPVDQDLDGPLEVREPSQMGMEPLEAASDRGGAEGGIPAQEVTLAVHLS